MAEDLVGRKIVKTEFIDSEVAFEIKAEFSQIMRFYNIAGLSAIPIPEFYEIMRNLPGKLEHVQRIELAWIAYTQVKKMDTKKQIKAVRDKLDIKHIDSEALQGALLALAMRIYADAPEKFRKKDAVDAAVTKAKQARKK